MKSLFGPVYDSLVIINSKDKIEAVNLKTTKIRGIFYKKVLYVLKTMTFLEFQMGILWRPIVAQHYRLLNKTRNQDN